MAPIYYGSLKQGIVSYGSDTIGKVFHGTDQVYSSVPPEPPVPSITYFGVHPFGGSESYRQYVEVLTTTGCKITYSTSDNSQEVVKYLEPKSTYQSISSLYFNGKISIYVKIEGNFNSIKLSSAGTTYSYGRIGSYLNETPGVIGSNFIYDGTHACFVPKNSSYSIYRYPEVYSGQPSSTYEYIIPLIITQINTNDFFTEYGFFEPGNDTNKFSILFPSNITSVPSTYFAGGSTRNNYIGGYFENSSSEMTGANFGLKDTHIFYDWTPPTT